MNLSITTRIILGFSIVLVMLLIVGTVTSRNLLKVEEQVDAVEHTLDVLQQQERLTGGLYHIQSIARGYVLTGDDSAQTQFRDHSADLRTVFDTLRGLTADNVRQQQRLERLGPLLDERLRAANGLMQSSIALPDTGNLDDLVRQGTGLTSAITGILAEVETEERRLLREREADVERARLWSSATLTYGIAAVVVLTVLGTYLLTRGIRIQLRDLVRSADRVAQGDYAARAAVQSTDEIGSLAVAFNAMAEQIEQRDRAMAEQSWLKTNLAKFSKLFEGERRLESLGHSLLRELAAQLGAQQAAMYVRSDDGTYLRLLAAYAAEGLPATVRSGQGLVGQAFSDKQRLIVSDTPDEYLRISSTLGSARPRCVVILPAVVSGETRAVIELAFLETCSSAHTQFLEQLAESLGLVVMTIQAGERTAQLLTQSQALTAELQAQSDKLRESEHLLKEQQEELRQTNEELEQANEELQQSNVEIEERSEMLSQQKLNLERSNREVEEARRALERQSAQLAQTSKYKSQFLANMSHELRTPLNSLLILSKVLADNNDGNLTAKQVQHARTINGAGHDLLELINEILDLSKIEAGVVDLDVTELQFHTFAELLEHTFRPIAEQKQLQFHVHRDASLGDAMTTDLRRLQQIVKNLISNALKFTHQGSVDLTIRPASREWRGSIDTLDAAAQVIAFEVRDTGIGIPADRLQHIFEAFQQADAGTSRKYGGTGLGLSISRELAQRLGGTLEVRSEVGQGSVFTLYLPREVSSAQLTFIASQMSVELPAPDTDTPIVPAHTPELPDIEPAPLEDDRDAIQPGDLTLLTIEDDASFAQVIAEFARDKGFKVVLAQTAGSGIALARRLRPTAITLDLRLPDADGRMVLDFLKHDPSTRHIPVHVISVDEARERMLRAGAVSFLQKPVTKEAIDSALSRMVEFVNRPMKNLLIVEDDELQRQNLVELITDQDVNLVAVATSAAAMEQIRALPFDCIVVDLVLPDGPGVELIRSIHQTLRNETPPIIVYTAKALSRQEETELRRLSEAIILKDARSPERLLDETALFLHRVQSKLTEPKRRLLEQVQRDDAILSGRKVLIVDDDVRNIFAIATALESYRMEVVYAESGRAGLELLESTPDIDAVLMDVMMPDMDGFETTQRIRRQDRYKTLPIIMVTAKAMKGDREKCLAAGASDYITKPVDMDQLRSLLRVWLYR